LAQTNEPTTECEILQIIASHWQLVLNLSYCSPCRWYNFTETCRRYSFNILMYL